MNSTPDTDATTDDEPEEDGAELVGFALHGWGEQLVRLAEPLTVPMVVKAWIAGLRGAGIDATQGKEWHGGGRVSTLPFVIEFSCPYGHRTPDRRRLARVQLIVEDDGWVSLDPASPCEKCSREVLERWLLTCPRRLAGEDVEESSAPLAFVLAEFRRLELRALAHWWVERTDEAEAAEGGPRLVHVLGVDGPIQYREWRLRWARGVLDTVTVEAPTKARERQGDWPVERTRAWMTERGIATTLGVHKAFALAKEHADNPPRSAIAKVLEADRSA